MTDRLQEIRARLDAATPGRGPWRADADFQSENPTLRVITGTYPDTVRMVAATLDAAETKFIAHAPADIAWLLDALASEQAHAEMLIERIDQLHLEVTRLRFGKPTPDVAYDIAVRRGSVGGYMGPQSQGPPPPALPPVGVEVVNPLTGERITREADDD